MFCKLEMGVLVCSCGISWFSTFDITAIFFFFENGYLTSASVFRVDDTWSEPECVSRVFFTYLQSLGRIKIDESCSFRVGHFLRPMRCAYQPMQRRSRAVARELSVLIKITAVNCLSQVPKRAIFSALWAKRISSYRKSGEHISESESQLGWGWNDRHQMSERANKWTNHHYAAFHCDAAVNVRGYWNLISIVARSPSPVITMTGGSRIHNNAHNTHNHLCSLILCDRYTAILLLPFMSQSFRKVVCSVVNKSSVQSGASMQCTNPIYLLSYASCCICFCLLK